MNRDVKDKFDRFILENSYDAILLTSPGGEVHRANDAACQGMDLRVHDKSCAFLFLETDA